MKVTKLLFTLILTSAAIAAATVPVEYLIASAAADFHEHGPAKSLHFRHVRVGHDVSADGTTMYMLCGEFTATQKAGKADWMPFATIKTSGYEQYMGEQAKGFCKRSSVVWDGQKDLSSSLQERFDSLH